MATRAQWDPAASRTTRYTNVAIILHWAIAALILFNLYTGFFGGAAFAFHISSGITILALSVFRVVWRLTHPRPAYPAEMKGWERTLAHANHFLFYVLMLAIPMTGWALVSASPPPNSPGLEAANAERVAAGRPPRDGRGPMIWGLFSLPKIAPLAEIGREAPGLSEQAAKHDQIEGLHLAGAWTMVVLLLLHIAGAMKHQLVDRWPELARMGIGRADRGA